MKSCALLTAPGFDYANENEKPLVQALKETGWEPVWVSWRDVEIDWSQFDWALLRTTWDYYLDPDFFLQRLKVIDKSSRLMNPIEIVEWNLHKTYLKDLTRWGVRTLPTLWAEKFSVSHVQEAFDLFDTDKLVIKPQVGAGSYQTLSIDKSKTSDPGALEEVWGLPMMVQPFFSSVQERGEFSVIFFAGELSHAALKTPRKGDYRSQEEFDSQVRAVSLSEEQLSFCKSILAQVPHWSLYARVDFLLDSSQVPHLIELELIEPSLFWSTTKDGAHKLVDKMNKAVNSQFE